jgi:SAM-dependent methyltransferase
VLDVGCGAGRVSLHLQERGHDVVAIDESPLAVEVTRRRGVRHAEALALAELDDSLGLFDTILVLRNNFGLDGFERLAERTRAGGRVLTDSVDPARVELPAGDHRFRVRWQRFASPWFRYVMASPAELERLVAGMGWQVVRVLDDGSPRFVAVLERARL